MEKVFIHVTMSVDGFITKPDEDDRAWLFMETRLRRQRHQNETRGGQNEEAHLIYSGGGKGAYEVDRKLVASLQRTLGADYEVKYPQMPNEDSPDYESWKGQIKKEIVALDGEMILIGQSVGGYILVKYLSEESQPENPMSGLFLIAAPYPGGDEDWQFEGFSLPEDFGTKLPKETPIFLYHSQDDRTVPFAHVALYAKAIPKVTLRETKGGHQLHNDLSVVAKDIKENL